MVKELASCQVARVNVELTYATLFTVTLVIDGRAKVPPQIMRAGYP